MAINTTTMDGIGGEEEEKEDVLDFRAMPKIEVCLYYLSSK